MVTLLIIADDFTGALDTSVHFAKRQISTLATTNRDIDFSALPEDVQVLAIDTETRHLSGQEAYRIVLDVARRAIEAGIPYLYKKTDSTLRGNIGAELSAFMDAAPDSSLVFAPAFPSNDRITVQGHQYFQNRPIHQTVFAQDPLEPITTSSISEIIGRQSTYPVSSLPVGAPTGRLLKKGCIHVFDASTQEDLDRLGQDMLGAPRPLLMGGSASLACSLSRLLPLPRVQRPAPAHHGSPLFLVGSVNQISLDQISYAAGQGYPLVRLTFEQQMDSAYYQRADSVGLIDEIGACLKQKRRCIVSTLDNREQLQTSAEFAGQFMVERDRLSAQIASNMGLLVRALLDRALCTSIVIFGGDTLLGVMERIGCRSILPMDEIQPGIVVSQAFFREKALLLITKAGGFGSLQVIPQIDSYLRAYAVRSPNSLEGEEIPCTNPF